ncbi:Nucleoside-diphosphate-sugar epimerase [Mariprofundus ferrinatatus]|uniref:Nucleoside-diphosphate-sugar epimerase n=2 Tax=Mariprofundus ferrinatatus TaxID=1921087 RepID=A0A2K8L2A8_9PROT|nr:Nucleoside-diphosphate-sugar epimerase [Mariprofundus ferrinatatus]
MDVVAVSRNAYSSEHSEVWVVRDLQTDDPFMDQESFDYWIHAGFLSLVPRWLESAKKAGVKRVVTFSSTSVFTKQDSSSPYERTIIRSLIEAEEELSRQCEVLGIDWTLLRPTMIYGAGRDKNVSFVQSMIRRFGLFPLVGGGKGKRMPVHADDLAQAAVAAMQSDAAVNRSYNLGGGETLTYREFVERIFTLENRNPRFINIPLVVARLLVHLVRLLPAFRHVTPAMFERMSIDLVFDYSDAARDLDYCPRPFTFESNACV